MTLEELREIILKYEEQLDSNQINELEEYIRNEPGVFPFNEWEYKLMYLRNKGIITFAEYENLRTNYVEENQYLNLYGLAHEFLERYGARSIFVGLIRDLSKQTKMSIQNLMVSMTS